MGLFKFIFFYINTLVVAMFLGVVNQDMNLGRVGWGLMIGWTIWCIFLPLIIEIVNQIIKIKSQGKNLDFFLAEKDYIFIYFFIF